MSDTAPAAEAASNNPADAAIKTEESADVKLESKTEPASDAAVAEESFTVKSDKATNGRNGHRDHGRDSKNDRSGKHGRDNKRGGGGGYNSGFKKDYKPSQRRAFDTSEFDNLPESNDPVEIRTQVEFYFADHNLSEDEYLFKLSEGPKNTPVSIKQLHTFKRMRRFQPYSAVVDALRDSEDLEVVAEDKFSGTGNEGVKRKTPLVVVVKDSDEKHPPSLQDLYERCSRASHYSKLDRSVYVKNFNGPEEKPDVKEVSQIKLELFFKPFGCVVVRKRRDEDGKYKGSVFVEFDSQESQQQFLALDPKPKFGGWELESMTKKEYNTMKCKEKGITPDWELKQQGFRGNRGGGGGGGRGRGGQRGRGRGRGGDRFNDRGRDGHRGPRRDRSGSRDSADSKDWNRRRDNFQKDRGFKNKGGKRDRSRSNEPSEPIKIERDTDGVPIIKDTRAEAENAASNKRKAEGDDRSEESKKKKLIILEDE